MGIADQSKPAILADAEAIVRADMATQGVLVAYRAPGAITGVEVRASISLASDEKRGPDGASVRLPTVRQRRFRALVLFADAAAEDIDAFEVGGTLTAPGWAVGRPQDATAELGIEVVGTADAMWWDLRGQAR